MTVGELIVELKRYDPEAKVVAEFSDIEQGELGTDVASSCECEVKLVVDFTSRVVLQTE